MLMDFGASLVSAVLNVSNFYFWIQTNYFDISSGTKPLLHTWSLGVEEQFYLIWPVLIIFLLKNASKPALYIIALCILSYISSVLLASFAPVNLDVSKTIFYLLPFRVFEFAAGSLLVSFSPRFFGRSLYYEILYAAGITSIFYAFIFFEDSLVFPVFNTFLPILGAITLIYVGDKAALSTLLTNRVVVYIGLISYSVYLIHWPLIVLIKYQYGELDYTEKALIVLLCLTVSFLSYKYVEKPIRNASFRNKKIVICIYAIMATVCIAGGASIYLTGGWLWRITNIEDAKFDYEKKLNSNSKNYGYISRKISPVGTESAADFHVTNYGGNGYPIGDVNPDPPADIILMGDSHSKQYAYGIDSLIAKPRNLKLHIYEASCFVLPNFTRLTHETNWDAYCPNVLNSALNSIKSSSKPLVILSISWLSQLDRAGLLDNDGRRLKRSAQKEDVLEGILSLKNLIGDAQLVVIGGVPRPSRLHYDVISRPNADLRSLANNDDFFYSKPNDDIVEFNDSLKRLALDSKKFIYLDPHQVLCMKNKCNNFSPEGDLIYSDSTHLSKSGSVVVIQGFYKELNALLSR